MSEISKKEELYRLICEDPFISQQALAERLGLSRSAVAGHIASLIRERRLLGRAYILPHQRSIVCVGGANIDRKVRTLGPLQMGTSNPVVQHETFGGVARNIAENLVRLGAPVRLLTAVGGDAAGQALLAHAESLGIDSSGSLQSVDTVSGSYTAILNEAGEMVVALAHMTLYDALTPEFLHGRQRQLASAMMIVADLNLPLDSICSLLDEARRTAKPLVIVAVSQPKMSHLPAKLEGLRLLILNFGELETRAGRRLTTEEEIADACHALRRDGAQDVIVTRGAAGVLYTTENGFACLPAPTVPVSDVTGAGDAFAAAVCWSLQQDSQDLALACRRGLTLAALTMQTDATVCPNLNADSLQQLLA